MFRCSVMRLMEPYNSNCFACGIGWKKGERRLIDGPSAQHVFPIVRDVVTSSMAGIDRQLNEAESRIATFAGLATESLSVYPSESAALCTMSTI